jgi:hypothetical protein
MNYKFSEYLRLNYQQIASLLNDEEELDKKEILERCSGEIEYDVLQSLKELVFTRIGKTPKGELYLL